jgi:hypothetical protein
MIWQTGLPIQRGNVVDDVDAGAGAGERLRILEGSVDQFHAGRPKVAACVRAGARADERPHLVAAGRKVLREMAAGEAGRARD